MNTPGTQVAEQFDNATQQGEAATLGMWVFLATELMFFGPLFFGYFYGRMHFPEGFAAASRHTEVMLGTINTAILLTSSLLMALAVQTRNAGLTQATQRLLFGVAALGIAFIVIKGIEYRHEWQEHLFPGAGFAFPDKAHAEAAQIFFYLYFAMTALHAMHLTIGIIMVVVFALALSRGARRFASAERLEVAGLYWHFIDVIWIFLYPILYLLGRSG